MDGLQRLDRQVLHERHLVSKELAGLERDAQVKKGAALMAVGDATRSRSCTAPLRSRAMLRVSPTSLTWPRSSREGASG